MKAFVLQHGSYLAFGEPRTVPSFNVGLPQLPLIIWNVFRSRRPDWVDENELGLPIHVGIWQRLILTSLRINGNPNGEPTPQVLNKLSKGISLLQNAAEPGSVEAILDKATNGVWLGTKSCELPKGV